MRTRSSSSSPRLFFLLFFFFFNDTATTEIYTLSLHDALPICGALPRAAEGRAGRAGARHGAARAGDAAVSPGVLHRGGGKARGAGRGDGVGARLGRRRGGLAREAVRPPGHGLQPSPGGGGLLY